jgi:succinate dehydrogenase / fumarate reductase cytochrome b subunit
MTANTWSAPLNSTVGAKVLMAVTGLVLMGFVFVHMVGNLQIFAGTPDAINAYARLLHSSKGVIWGFRLVMLVSVALHVYAGILLWLHNRASRPVPYAFVKTQRTSFSAKTMIFGGIAVAAFLGYHLWHFTIRQGNPGFGRMTKLADGTPVFDVYTMVVEGFRDVPSSVFYIVAVLCLAFHLRHAASSWFQTLGLRTVKYQRGMDLVGPAFAVLIALGMCAVPLAILAGFVK